MDKDFLQKLIGKEEKEAIKLIEDNNYKSRIVSRDGNHYIVTKDYKTDRINLDIDLGVVTYASFG